MKHKVRKHKMRGKGVIEDVDNFLKKTKLLSTVAQAGLPFIAGALSSIGGPLGTAGGIAAGTALGTAAATGLKNYGYGKRKMMGGAIYQRGQVPLHKMVGAGGCGCGLTGDVRGTMGRGRMYGGSSVFNNVASEYATVKF